MSGEEFGTLPYGIKPREVQYQCLNCGHVVTKTELDQMPSLMCPRCGYRIFVKVRSIASIRKVKAV